MPFSSSGTLKDDQVYAVVAYILSEAKIIKPTDTMDAPTLAKVTMPNRDGLVRMFANDPTFAKLLTVMESIGTPAVPKAIQETNQIK